MSRPSGALRIFQYNWPTFVGTWTLGLAALGAARAIDGGVGAMLAAGAVGAIAWSVAALLVSFHVYDRSALVGGRWIPALLPRARTWALVHAGLDAEIDVDAVMPAGGCVARLDVFDPELMTAPSIGRARVRTPLARTALPCPPTALALEAGTCDAIVVPFTAHEIRARGARARFFQELVRALRPDGTILLVEHLRDLPNLLAYGPGFLHFAPRREWLRVAAEAGLVVTHETRITPWVMALCLGRAP